MWNRHNALGYYYHKITGKYAATFGHKHLGLFDTPQEARIAHLNVKEKFNKVKEK